MRIELLNIKEEFLKEFEESKYIEQEMEQMFRTLNELNIPIVGTIEEAITQFKEYFFSNVRYGIFTNYIPQKVDLYVEKSLIEHICQYCEIEINDVFENYPFNESQAFSVTVDRDYDSYVERVEDKNYIKNYIGSAFKVIVTIPSYDRTYDFLTLMYSKFSNKKFNKPLYEYGLNIDDYLKLCKSYSNQFNFTYQFGGNCIAIVQRDFKNFIGCADNGYGDCGVVYLYGVDKIIKTTVDMC